MGKTFWALRKKGTEDEFDSMIDGTPFLWSVLQECLDRLYYCHGSASSGDHEDYEPVRVRLEEVK